MHIHLDPIGGLSGDMFVAAMVDALPHLSDEVTAALASIDLGSDVHAELIPHGDGVFTGGRFLVTCAGLTDGDRAPDDHEHRSFRTIRDLLARSPLDDRVRALALDVFTRLAEAEGRVHGIDPDDVTFHEVGAWDSICDVVAAAAAIVGSGATSWSTDPLPLGAGTVHTAHGDLPVPAPATTELLEGFAVVDDGVRGERVTPTGAAILRSLRPTPSRPDTPVRLGRSGIGFGSRRLPGRSNILRVTILLPLGGPGDHPDTPLTRDTVGVIEFDIDDQPAEDLAVGLDRLRALPGVLDAIQRAAFGKKGRLVTEVRILCAPESLERTIAACFLETSTIGVRHHVRERAVLSRSISDEDGLRVKRATRPDGTVTAKVDIDDLATAGDRRAREVLRREAEPVHDNFTP